jgi:hypothetical protein
MPQQPDDTLDPGPAERELLDRLRAAVEWHDPVPPALVDGGRTIYGWLRLDAELAELLFDSALEHDTLAGVRSAVTAGGVRSLTFESASLAVELDVVPVATPDRRRIVGQIVPAREARLELRHRTGVVELDVDASGRFVVEPVPTGRMSVRCRVATPTALHIETAWVSI